MCWIVGYNLNHIVIFANIRRLIHHLRVCIMAFNEEPQASTFGETSQELNRIHQDIDYWAAISTGGGVAVGVGVMAALGRFAVVYGPKTTMLGYLWLTLFVAPLTLTYGERSEAIGAPGGVYGLVRNRYGLALSFLVGWLEIGGYAAISAILARLIVVYALTFYSTFGGGVALSLDWLTMGVIALFLIFKVTGWRGGRRLNALLVYLALIFLAALSIYSVTNYHNAFTGLTSSLRSVRPLRLSALLMSSFWGVLMIYGFRHRILRRRKGVLLQIHWAIMLIVIALGGLMAIATLPSVSIDSTFQHVLSVNPYSGLIFTGSDIVTALLALFSLALTSMGLSRSLQSGVEVISTMTGDVFFPSIFNYRLHKTLSPPLLISAILAILFGLFADAMVIVGAAASFLLWMTILVHVPDVFSPRPRLPRDGVFRLPYHPLFPGLTVVAATVAVFNLTWDNMQEAFIWLVIGLLALGAYSYRRALRARGKHQTYDETALAEERSAAETGAEAKEDVTPSVLVFVHDLKNLSRILALGSRLAVRAQARLSVVQVIEVSEQQPVHVQRKMGREMWENLALLARNWEVEQEDATLESRIKPIVRLTPGVIEGIINAAQEEHARFLLIPPDFMADEPALNMEQYDKVLRLAPGNILFFNQLPESDELKRVTVLVGDGGHALASLTLADALTAPDGVIEVIHYVQHGASLAEEVAAREKVQRLIYQSDTDDHRVQLRILRMATLEDAVNELISDTDMLVLGAARNFMTRRSFFGGVNARIFQSLSVTTALVRAQEYIRFAWFSRLWETITAPLPKLTLAERAEVVREVTSGATPSVDFFVLIILSSGIAMYGLLQNSGAVIIGAMLVAPLMSPIVSMAMSIVRGDIKHLGQGAQSTAQGVLMAIFVGALLTFFSPIRQPTNEIMARVNPNLLDLGVAFLSGAAGGYAMSRKSIAAALPGVAIAAALVPPLAVAGYGLATADLNIAFGALLLFTTNLIAIVLAAALVFLALDFLSPEKQSWGEVVRGLKITLVFLAFIVIILGAVTYRSVLEQHQLDAIHQVVTKRLYQKSFEPLDVKITHIRDGYKLSGIVLSYDRPLNSNELAQLGQDLQDAVGAPVTMDIVFIPADKELFTFDSVVATTKIEEAIRDAIEGLPVELVSIHAEPVSEGYVVTLAVIEFQPGALSQQMVASLEDQLSQKFDAPIAITLYKIPAEKFEMAPTSATPFP